MHGSNDVRRGQRPVQASLGTCLGFHHDRLGFQATLEFSRDLFFVRGVAYGGSLQVGYLLERRRCRGHGQAARNQEVTRVTIGDLFDLTGFGHVGDVFFEKDFHDRTAPPNRIEQMC